MQANPRGVVRTALAAYRRTGAPREPGADSWKSRSAATAGSNVVIAAGGHGTPFGPPLGDSLVAFALPPSPPSKDSPP